MQNQWIEFNRPVGQRVLVRASAVQGLEEDGDQSELQLGFGSLTVRGSFDENAEKLRATENDSQ